MIRILGSEDECAEQVQILSAVADDINIQELDSDEIVNASESSTRELISHGSITDEIGKCHILNIIELRKLISFLTI